MWTRSPASLRAKLSVITGLISVLALAIAGALVTLTSTLHRTTLSAGAAVESVRLAEEAEISLLLHERARGAAVVPIEVDLRRNLGEARTYLTTGEEARVLDEAVAAVEFYLRQANADAAPDVLSAAADAAYGALEAFVDLNVAQSKAALARSSRWDALGDAIGVATGLLVILLAGWLVWWLRNRAFQPIFALGSVMERFGTGDRSARAEEVGGVELEDIARRFNELATALDEQKKAQAAFLGGVAHDLRNPLTALRLSISPIKPSKPLPPEDRIRRTIEMVGRQITRLERMLEDFVDMSKIEAGKLELRFESQDAREIVSAVVDLFEGVSPRHHLQVSLPDSEIRLRCDPVRIEQVVTNLVSNAIKYSPEGGDVGVVVEANRDEMALSVTDTGIGISAEDQRRLFEPYRRVGLSQESLPGVGLGLFVVRRIVEAHGGSIAVESHPGAGSTFRVHLPLLEQRA